MLLKRIRQFHEKTLADYSRDHYEGLEPWKKKVMDLHEQSHFLYYYDSCELEKPDGSQLVIQGETAKGQLPVGGRLYLYDGQARLLGEGILLSDPYSKEEKRRGFLRSRKNECIVKIMILQGKDYEEMTRKEQQKGLKLFFDKASLLSDILI